MGMEYRQFVVPDDRSIRPEPQKVVQLIAALIDASYIPQSARLYLGEGQLQPQKILVPAEPPKTLLDRMRRSLNRNLAKPRTVYRDQGSILPLPVPNDGAGLLDRPEVLIKWDNLNGCASAFGGAANGGIETLTLKLSDDFVSELFEEEEIPGCHLPICSCGLALTYTMSYDSLRVRQYCLGCGARFRPNDEIFPPEHEIGGGPEGIPGGALHRFCIKIYAGKYIHRNNPNFRNQASPEFMELCRKVLDMELRQFFLQN